MITIEYVVNFLNVLGIRQPTSVVLTLSAFCNLVLGIILEHLLHVLKMNKRAPLLNIILKMSVNIIKVGSFIKCWLFSCHPTSTNWYEAREGQPVLPTLYNKCSILRYMG